MLVEICNYLIEFINHTSPQRKDMTANMANRNPQLWSEHLTPLWLDTTGNKRTHCWEHLNAENFLLQAGLIGGVPGCCQFYLIPSLPLKQGSANYGGIQPAA